MQHTNWGGDKPSKPRRGRWSQAEIARFRETYGLRDDASVARELNRSVSSVRKMAEQVFNEPLRSGPWTPLDGKLLKKYLGATTPEVIAKIMARPVDQVRRQIEALGQDRLEGSATWSQEESAELKRVFGTRTDEDLSLIFGRPVQSLLDEAERLCLAKDKAFVRRVTGEATTRMPRWKDSELEILRELYPLEPNLSIAKSLGRSVKSVVSKAHNMGLKKNPERLQQMGQQNVSLRYNRKG
ncbi:MAG: hypothetical protein QF724_09010 [Planctomycetota bacterium]|nr:hypothetical protein [Planctomycetota bacterium]MDP6518314.1 hypothetical protein [Planctomycetota bacterium]MDP6839061.1 hypothetical protein [Planctomycetota bacterium]MDP6954514.1 hypothetical protein [Planctomycetota bacterium]